MEPALTEAREDFMHRMSLLFAEVQEGILQEYDQVNSRLKATMIKAKQHRRKKLSESRTGSPTGDHPDWKSEVASRRSSWQSILGDSVPRHLHQSKQSRWNKATDSRAPSRATSGALSPTGDHAGHSRRGSFHSHSALGHSQAMVRVDSGGSIVTTASSVASPGKLFGERKKPSSKHVPSGRGGRPNSEFGEIQSVPECSQHFKESFTIPSVPFEFCPELPAPQDHSQDDDNEPVGMCMVSKPSLHFGDDAEKSDTSETSNEEFDFVVLDPWLKDAPARKSSKHSNIHHDSLRMQSLDDVGQSGDVPHFLTSGLSLHSIEERHVFHPCSPSRLIWDFACMVLIICDLIFVPLDFVEPQDAPLNQVIEWIGRCFWTCDIALLFRTGYFDAYGTLHMSPDQCQKRYFQTWFGVDFMLVVLGWTEGIVLVAIGGDVVWRRSHWLRAVRIVRAVRFWRLLRMAGTFDFLRWRSRSEAIMLLASILRNVVGIIMLTHYVACFWYGVSKISNGGVNRWINRYNAAHATSPSMMARYNYSFLWALQQFISFGLVEDTDVDSILEMMYGVATMLFTFVISACFVSMITTSMTSFQILNEKNLVQTTALRKFLLDHGVSPSLAARIQRNALYAAQEQKQHTPEKDIELLNVVSKPLRMELRCELYSPYITAHIFFNVLEQQMKLVFSSVCNLAISELFVSGNDVVFIANDVPAYPAVLFLTKGVATYFWGEVRSSETLDAGTTVCEAFLWTEWIYQGTLCAMSSCKLLSLDAACFQKVLRETSQGPQWVSVQNYAREFVAVLNQMDATDLNDLMPLKFSRAGAAKAFHLDECSIPDTQLGSSSDNPIAKRGKVSSQSDNSAFTDASQGSFKVLNVSSDSSSKSLVRLPPIPSGPSDRSLGSIGPSVRNMFGFLSFSAMSSRHSDPAHLDASIVPSDMVQ